MIWVLPLSLLIFFELVADILAKEYSLHATWYRWVFAIAGYVIANTFWLIALRHGSGLARGAVIFSVATAVIAVLVGVFLYKEELSRPQILGVLIGIISLVLIFWNE